ncbi:MAG: hypothetical protein J6S21_03755, partial [Victivallales bacterium]|nr:hypothetical protein [Victivallales bacterium]
MDNKDFAGGLIEFDAVGRLVRLGDYAESRELNGTSFAFQADGCCCDFAPPEIRGEDNLRTLHYLAQDGKAEEVKQLRQAAEEFYRAKCQAELEAMDVELLAQGKQGIRV